MPIFSILKYSIGTVGAHFGAQKMARNSATDEFEAQEARPFNWVPGDGSVRWLVGKPLSVGIFCVYICNLENRKYENM